MLTALHVLLTYKCNMECDHCFLYCGPRAAGTFTADRLRQLLAEAQKIGTVNTIYFEGGEPFLFYPLLREGMRLAKERGFKTGIVTNGYWATSENDAKLWLTPLAELNLSDLTVSDDELHYGDAAATPPKFAIAAARALGLPLNVICKQKPQIKIADPDPKTDHGRDAHTTAGRPEISGGVKLRGRAVERFAPQLPTRPWEEFTRCPYENLAAPSRIHIDPYGHVFYCQGLSIGNAWETPLSELLRSYDPQAHPICGPLLAGGPAELVRRLSIPFRGQYVDECHLCYCARAAILERFPQFLAPRQAYGPTPAAAYGPGR